MPSHQTLNGTMKRSMTQEADQDRADDDPVGELQGAGDLAGAQGEPEDEHEQRDRQQPGSSRSSRRDLAVDEREHALAAAAAQPPAMKAKIMTKTENGIQSR